MLIHEPRLRWPVQQDLPNILQNLRLETIDRRGKYLLFRFEPGTLIAHLGMSGSLRLTRQEEEKRKHDHVEIGFSEDALLRYHDPRRFGCLLWTGGQVEQHPLIRSLGVEPLGDDFTSDYLHKAARRKSCSIKTLIMTSTIVTGVGNIYANEALFISGILPGRLSSELNFQESTRLVGAIKSVLEASIRQGGSTLRDFVNGHGAPGYFQQTLKVYQRGGQGCLVCGHPIVLERISQRSSFYCTQCQH